MQNILLRAKYAHEAIYYTVMDEKRAQHFATVSSIWGITDGF